MQETCGKGSHHRFPPPVIVTDHPTLRHTTNPSHPDYFPTTCILVIFAGVRLDMRTVIASISGLSPYNRNRRREWNKDAVIFAEMKDKEWNLAVIPAEV